LFCWPIQRFRDLSIFISKLTHDYASKVIILNRTNAPSIRDGLLCSQPFDLTCNDALDLVTALVVADPNAPVDELLAVTTPPAGIPVVDDGASWLDIVTALVVPDPGAPIDELLVVTTPPAELLVVVDFVGWLLAETDVDAGIEAPPAELLEGAGLLVVVVCDALAAGLLTTAAIDPETATAVAAEIPLKNCQVIVACRGVDSWPGKSVIGALPNEGRADHA
jgi:hypothetical protein